MKRVLLIVFFLLCAVAPSHAARQVLLNQATAYDAFDAADDNFLELYNSVSASTITVDLEDDGGDDTEALDEIAPTNDTNSIFSVTGNKLTIDVSQNWPTADNATTANSANSATTATTATTANAGDSATAFFSSGTIEADRLPAASSTTAGIVPTTSGASEGDVPKVQADGTLAWEADSGSGGAVDTSGTPVANDFAKFTDADTIEGRSYTETKQDLSLDAVENTALSTWAGTANVITVGTVSTGTWEATDVGIAHGGTGASTAQAAIDALTNVSAATNEWVLTKDTATGNAIFKANPGAGSGTVDTTGTVNADEIAVWSDSDTLKALTEAEFKTAYNMEAGTDYLAQQTIGIADNNLLEVDHAAAADNDYAKFTANGIEGRSYAEVRTDLAVADISGTIAANDIAKFSDADTIIGRSYSEIKSDLSLGNVENTALSTWNGTANVTTLGTITTGTWRGSVVDHERGGLEANVSAYSGLVAIASGSTAEIDSKAELEGQIADVSDFAEADGDTYTGTHNFGSATLQVENVYAQDFSGIILKDDAGTTALTVLDGANVQVANNLGIGTVPTYALHLLETGSSPYVYFDYAAANADSVDLFLTKRRGTSGSSQNCADNDKIGRIIWRFINSATESIDSPSITATVTDVTDATEDAEINIRTLAGGTAYWTMTMMGNLVGILNQTPSVALDVNGDIEYTGTITDVSDERLKENIAPVENALDIVTSLDGVYFNMKDTPERREVGFIAQNVQQILPEAVSVVDPENGYLGVSYTQVIPVLVEAIKELRATVEQQAAEIAALKEGSK